MHILYHIVYRNYFDILIQTKNIAMPKTPNEILNDLVAEIQKLPKSEQEQALIEAAEKLPDLSKADFEEIICEIKQDIDNLDA